MEYTMFYIKSIAFAMMGMLFAGCASQNTNRNYCGQREGYVRISGIAMDSKFHAVLISGGKSIPIANLTAWPSEMHEQQVVVEGQLKYQKSFIARLPADSPAEYEELKDLARGSLMPYREHQFVSAFHYLNDIVWIDEQGRRHAPPPGYESTYLMLLHKWVAVEVGN